MSTGGWVWDANSNQYRIWSPAEQCWVLQSGVRLPNTQIAASHPSNAALAASTNTAWQPTGGSTAYTPNNLIQGQRLAGAIQNLVLNQAPNAQASSAGNSNNPPIPSGLINRDRTVDQYGRTTLRGTKGKQEPLDKRFVRRKDPEDFYSVGRVFKILWAEQPGDREENITIVSAETWKEKFVVKIRWFVVVREGVGCSSCLPIQTYGRRGMNNGHLRPQDHAIIFTGGQAPELAEFEEPIRSSVAGVMQRAIRVAPESRGARMDSLSRLNYRKIYNVEHKVKVFNFGRVHPQYEGLFISSFDAVWNTPLTNQLVALHGDDDEDDEDGAGDDGAA